MFFIIIRILFTGNILGVTNNHKKLVHIFRLMRRKGYISGYVSIYPSYLHKTVYISSDSGRLCRPYVIVTNGKPLVTEKHIMELEKGIRGFEDFLHDGIFKFLNTEHGYNFFYIISRSN